jgi:hemoglobin
MNTTLEAVTPYDLVGGSAVVRRFVDRFYDLMEQEPRYGELRALHAADLGPMRESLAGFLIAWLGGPRDWFEQRPGACVMSAHARVAVTGETSAQWVDAMRRALLDSGVDADLAARMCETFARMAGAMGRR